VSHIVTYADGAVGVITIDRMERFNSLHEETARDLRKAGLSFARDARIRAVVLRGKPGAFCSGADFKTIRAAGAPYGDSFQQILEYIHSTISEIRRAPKPFIAAVDGIAAAGGFGLAMSCDLVVASARAWFEWAYAKTGLTGAESSTFFLPRLIGLRRAMELLFLNPRLDARAALDYGLITAVSPVETFDEDVMSMARRLAEGPTEALGIAKDLMNQAAGMDRLELHLDRELEQLARIANG
jgi:2-(1,2-epoxy-1,2-dihydrophenyl)acetyl-CoA isomerase